MSDFIVIIGGSGCAGFLTGTMLYFAARKMRKLLRGDRRFRHL